MLTLILLASTLILAPPAAEPTTTYEQARGVLESATAAVGDLAPEEAIAALEAALAGVAEHPRELLQDAQTSEAIRHARVALAWLHLARDDRQAAADAMDEALRSSGGSPLPLAGLGPDIRKLHDERLAALEAAGTATIEVECDACDILIDEGKASNSSEHYLGVHRVWIFDSLDVIPPRYEEVNLDTADAVSSLVYAAAEQVFEPEELPQAPAPPPRPTEVVVGSVVTGLGGGLIAGGAVLYAIHGDDKGKQCENIVDPCPYTHNTRATGTTLTSLGVAFLATGITLLVIHAKEKRSNRSALRVVPRGLGVAF